MILIIDNYDSFVYNLARYVSQLGREPHVVRNDKITLSQIEALQPSHIVLSPGPCAPDQAGICLPLIRYFAGVIPILGVCLGHQAIGQAFGGIVTHALRPMHGKTSSVIHDGVGLFQGIKNPLKVSRYHSLIVSHNNFPKTLRITACSSDNEIMALEHYIYPVYGVQFHPESILSEQGHDLLRNFLDITQQGENNGATSESRKETLCLG